MQSEIQTCEFGITGIERPLEGEKGFKYAKKEGLNVVLTGRAGTGKSILALQMAFTGRIKETGTSLNALYLTKDMSPETLVSYVVSKFRLFDRLKEDPAVLEHVLDEIDFIDLTKEEYSKVPRTRATLVRSCMWDANALKKDGIPGRLSTIVFLDQLVANAYTLFQEKAAEEIRGVLAEIELPVFAAADLNLAATAPAEFSRNMFDGPLLTVLWHLCPNLRRAFDEISNRPEWSENLLVVVDSLSLPLLEQCLRFQAERPRGQDSSRVSHHPFSVYIAEVPDVPQNIETSYPPDVQIRLDAESRDPAVEIKTLQVQKARFQRVRHEVFPMVVTGDETAVGHVALFDTPQFAAGQTKRATDKDPVHFERRRRGITILPSLSDAATCREPMPKRGIQEIKFGTLSLDQMTREGSLAGGGCTLVMSGGRCHSTIFGLHFLLGAIGDELERHDRAPSSKFASASLPRSVLYISVDTDLLGVLHDIWRYPLLRRAIWKYDEHPAPDLREAWKRVEERAGAAARLGVRKPGECRAWHRLYKIPLLHGPYTRHCACPETSRPGPYLYVLIPDFTWCTPEEVLDRIERLLHFSTHDGCPYGYVGSDDPVAQVQHTGECLRIDRVLFNRSSRAYSRWPMVKDVTVFLSDLAQMCQSHLVELMLIDDSPQVLERTNERVSSWIGISQNLIRLQRIPFHAGEAVAMELIRSHGRRARVRRPQELYSRHLPAEAAAPNAMPLFPQQELCVRDAFRGYTGLFTDTPRHARVMVDLVYDRKNSPLYRDIQNTARNLRMLVEGIEVNVRGPNARPGINSALSNLSSVSHDTCHVAAIDEVWIHRIIGDGAEPSGLAELTGLELASALPTHVRERIQGTREDEEVVHAAVKEQYATEAMTVACRKAGKRETVYCIPYWNNWGVLVISRPKIEALRRLFDAVVAAVSKREKLEQVFKDPEELAQWGGEGARALAGVLLRRSDWIRQVKDPDIKDVALRASSLFYHSGMGQRISRRNQSRQFTWEHMRLFKERLWDAVAGSPRVQEIQRLLEKHGSRRRTDAERTAVREVGKWFGPRTELHLFDCHRDRTESPVCFFLELLLTLHDMPVLFETCPDRPPGNGDTPHRYNTADLLYFRTDPTARAATVDVLELLYRLLSPAQRRQLALGLTRRPMTTSAEAPGSGKSPGPHPSHGTAADESSELHPESYALFAREWLSTIPDVGTNKDLRERIVLRHLPAAGGEKASPQAAIDHLYHVMTWPAADDKNTARKKAAREVRDLLPGVGATLSGTWYLGALSGGNLDVACDIIREVVSAYHERERVITGCTGPVTKQFFELINQEEDTEQFVPYAEIIDKLLKVRPALTGEQQPEEENTPSVNAPTFPFCRGRIRAYTSISLELNELVRHTMSIGTSASRNRRGGRRTGWSSQERRQVKNLVSGTFRRIESLNNEVRRRGAQAPLAPG